MKPLACVAPIAASTVLVLASACSSRAPNAQPPERRCQVLWSSPGGVTGTFDVYLVDLPISRWTTGTVSLAFAPGDVRIAEIETDYDVTTGSWSSAAVATSGTLTLTVAGTSSGDAITLDDAGGHAFFDLASPSHLGDSVGSGGTAAFHGVWSASGSVQPGDAGDRASLSYRGSSLSIGDYTRYAECYDPPPGS